MSKINNLEDLGQAIKDKLKEENLEAQEMARSIIFDVAAELSQQAINEDSNVKSKVSDILVKMLAGYNVKIEMQKKLKEKNRKN